MSNAIIPDIELANVIRAERILAKETQEQIAYKAELTVAAYSRIERGTANPTWTTVRRIAAALDMSVAGLVEGL